MNIILFEAVPKFISFTDPVGRHLKKVLKVEDGEYREYLLNGLQRRGYSEF